MYSRDIDSRTWAVYIPSTFKYILKYLVLETPKSTVSTPKGQRSAINQCYTIYQLAPPISKPRNTIY